MTYNAITQKYKDETKTYVNNLMLKGGYKAIENALNHYERMASMFTGDLKIAYRVMVLRNIMVMA